MDPFRTAADHRRRRGGGGGGHSTLTSSLQMPALRRTLPPSRRRAAASLVGGRPVTSQRTRMTSRAGPCQQRRRRRRRRRAPVGRRVGTTPATGRRWRRAGARSGRADWWGRPAEAIVHSGAIIPDTSLIETIPPKPLMFGTLSHTNKSPGYFISITAEHARDNSAANASYAPRAGGPTPDSISVLNGPYEANRHHSSSHPIS